MLKDFITSLEIWNSTKNERQKLQYAYLVLAVVIIFISGLISLINAELGHAAVLFGLFAFAAFIANGIVWNLVNAIILSKLSKSRKR